MTISEADWRKFTRLRLIALDRFCQRVLDECQAICTAESMTVHERYGELFGRLQKRDREMRQAFDDFRRSTAAMCLRLMVIHDLVTEEELSEFSSEVRDMVRAR
jgi:hypothetical protein